MNLTIILPTYNNERTLNECLKSIFSQDYSMSKYEVLLIDGGSADNTLIIAKKYPVKIINNPKRVEEAARIIGIKKARGKIIAFIDADNILMGKDWITRMMRPFSDKRIFFADTLYFSYRKNDKWGVKYQALIGGDDPLAMYLGLYNRWCYLYGDWTDYPHEDLDRGDYLKCRLLNNKKVPPMGSNGFLIRTKILRKFVKETFIHSDLIYELVNNGYNSFAKVKTGIIHNQPRFFSNKIRRIKRRVAKEVRIKYNYGMTKKNLLRASIYIALIIPVIIDTIRGFIKKPESAWLFHPIACLGELSIYVYNYIKSPFNIE
ncbi:glycosyltransferase family 2 protein [Candidatus Pacearchaeota archaeon]|nr:glycosyltransferase family 2 protein [Candidatus Pacearchaeota archaeon]